MNDFATEAACTRDSLDTQSRIYTEYARGNRAAVLEALAEDVAWHSVDCAAIPWGGSYRGREGVETFFARLDSGAEIIGYEVERVIAQGEWVTVLARVRARFPATGAEAEFASADILRIRDGRILEFREFYDTAAVLAALQGPRAG
jgi:ketosteroid isomerase-like protein